MKEVDECCNTIHPWNGSKEVKKNALKSSSARGAQIVLQKTSSGNSSRGEC